MAAYLQQLPVLVLYPWLLSGMARYTLIQKALSWDKARGFCQKHYVDLAVLSSELQYHRFWQATTAEKASFWLGLQRERALGSWRWVDGEDLSYEKWLTKNNEGRCASLETVLKKEEKLLARYCEESHYFICQGPVPPQSVKVESFRADHVTLSWKVSAFMQMIPHAYNVTTCAATTCNTLLYPYTNGSARNTVTIYNLTYGVKYFINVAAFVVRPNSDTSEYITLQSDHTTLSIKTGSPMIMKMGLLLLVAVLGVVYLLLKRDDADVVYPDPSPEELSTKEEATV